MRFVAPEPGLTEQSSWEAPLGALGRRAEGQQDGGAAPALWGLAVSWSWLGEPLSRGVPPGAVWRQEMETNPPHPAVQSKRESKAAENPGFPFLSGGEGCGKETDKLSGCSSTFSRCLCTPIPRGEPALPALPGDFGVS